MKVQTGQPTQNGMYVIYTAGVFERFPDKTLMMFINGEWGYPSSDQKYRMGVTGWLGPLPNPTMDDLQIQEIQEDNAYGKHAYAIGKKLNQYTEGPFFEISEILNSLGDEGEYIFKVGSDKDVAIRKWVESKGKWIRLKRKKK